MAAWLERRGVAPADLVIDRGGYRTAASMADAAARASTALLVVSQPYHLPRALYLARHAGLRAVGVAARQPGRRALVGPAHQPSCARRPPAPRRSSRWRCAGVRGLPPERIPQAAPG